jgi:hypothetical protein
MTRVRNLLIVVFHQNKRKKGRNMVEGLLASRDETNERGNVYV